MPVTIDQIDAEVAPSSPATPPAPGEMMAEPVEIQARRLSDLLERRAVRAARLDAN